MPIPTKAEAKKKKIDPYAWGSVWTPARMYELTESLKEFVEDNIESGEKFLISEWCFQNGVMPKRLSYLCEKDKDFKQAYELARDWEEHCLVEKSLFNKCNHKFASLMLACRYHWASVREEKEEKHRTALQELAESAKLAYQQLKEENATQGPAL